MSFSKGKSVMSIRLTFLNKGYSGVKWAPPEMRWESLSFSGAVIMAQSCMTACLMVTPVWELLDSLPVIYTVSAGKTSYFFTRENVLENQAHCGFLKRTHQANFR